MSIRLSLCLMLAAAPARAQISARLHAGSGTGVPAVPVLSGVALAPAADATTPGLVLGAALAASVSAPLPSAIAVAAAPAAPEAIARAPRGFGAEAGAARASALEHVRLAASAPDEAGARFDGRTGRPVDDGGVDAAAPPPMISPRRELPAKIGVRADPTELGALNLSVKFGRTTTSKTTRALFSRLGIESRRYEPAESGYWLFSSAPSVAEAARLALLLAEESIVSEIEIGGAAARLIAPAAPAGAALAWRLKVREDGSIGSAAMKVRVKSNADQADVDRVFPGLKTVKSPDGSYVVDLPPSRDSALVARAVARHAVTTAVFAHPDLLARLDAPSKRSRPASSLLDRRPDAVLFDWDDTLASEKELADAATLELFRRFNRPAPTLAAARRQWNSDHAMFYARFFPGLPREAVDDAWNDITSRLRRGETIGGKRFDRVTLLPGAAEVLEALTNLGVPLAVVSNKSEDELLREIAASGLGRYFKHVRGHAPGRSAKPSPQPVDESLKALGVKPGNVWFIGDQLSDMEAARGAGMRRILVGKGSRSLTRGRGLENDPAGEIVFIDSLRRLPPLLRRLPKAGRTGNASASASVTKNGIFAKPGL